VIAVAEPWACQAPAYSVTSFCARMKKRNVTALVTRRRDARPHGVLASALPVWCAGVAAPASVNGLTFVGWQQPIGVAAADLSGRYNRHRRRRAVVIPQAMLDFRRHEGAGARAFTKAGYSAKSRKA